jgi:hypothetical protein
VLIHFSRGCLQRLYATLAGSLLLPFVAFTFLTDKDTLENAGRVYAAILQVQITLDLFVFGFVSIAVRYGPKGER